ncbi:hypothetical protein GF352_04365, partial [archaeon]|nr:hypothetical protein [archaeon]
MRKLFIVFFLLLTVAFAQEGSPSEAFYCNEEFHEKQSFTIDGVTYYCVKSVGEWGFSTNPYGLEADVAEGDGEAGIDGYCYFDELTVEIVEADPDCFPLGCSETDNSKKTVIIEDTKYYCVKSDGVWGFNTSPFSHEDGYCYFDTDELTPEIVDQDNDCCLYVEGGHCCYQLIHDEGLSIWSKEVISSNSDMTSVFFADLTGDGDLDVLAGSESGSVILLTGSGFGNEQVIGSLAGRVNSLVSVDLDADGDLDVLAGGEGVAWFENDGSWTKHLVDGSFT